MPIIFLNGWKTISEEHAEVAYKDDKVAEKFKLIE